MAHQGDELTFDHTVHRALVDRGDATTVLVTSWHKRGNELRCGAVWPRLGGYYTLLDPELHDPLLALETFRQCALLSAHVVDDVPLATMQIMRSYELTVEAAGLKVAADPTEVTVTLRSEHHEPAGHSILQTTMIGEMYRDGTRFVSAIGKAVVPPNDRYLRVRGRDPEQVRPLKAAMGPAVDPRTVGRTLDRDVVISAGPPDAPSGTYLMRIDPEHPNFFDNPTDHTPGMLLTEAMRQAVVAESGDPYYLPLAVSVRFFRFVELDQPSLVVVRRTATSFQTEVLQTGAVTTRAEWSLAGTADA
jgi:2-oxo-3-(phosphooxy)propyl 3-oxoalkanoate synthase